MKKVSFQAGDFVFLKDDPHKFLWHINEIVGRRALLGDVGYETSNIIQEWRGLDELEPDVGQYGEDF